MIFFSLLLAADHPTPTPLASLPGSVWPSTRSRAITSGTSRHTSMLRCGRAPPDADLSGRVTEGVGEGRLEGATEAEGFSLMSIFLNRCGFGGGGRTPLQSKDKMQTSPKVQNPEPESIHRRLHRVPRQGEGSAGAPGPQSACRAIAAAFNAHSPPKPVQFLEAWVISRSAPLSPPIQPCKKSPRILG